MKRYSHAGPVPVIALSDSLEQIEKQGWTVEHIAFAGMVQIKSVLEVMKENPPMPAYVIVSSTNDLSLSAPGIKLGK